MFHMTIITIERKKYVLVPEREYKSLKKKASQKTTVQKILSLKEGKSLAYKMIEKWARAEK
jgi:hypothetical protein